MRKKKRNSLSLSAALLVILAALLLAIDAQEAAMNVPVHIVIQTAEETALGMQIAERDMGFWVESHP